MKQKSKPEEFKYPDFTFGINQVFDKTFDSGWVTFPGHYLLYASKGAFRLEVDNKRWLLPPQRAAWVAAHVPLRLHADGPGTTSSVLFSKDSIAKPPFKSRVFSVSNLAREMLLYAMQWGPDRDYEDQPAKTFFLSLATVCTELTGTPDEFWMPQVQSAELNRAIEYTTAHLDEKLSFSQVAKTAFVSERTLARRFFEETGMNWSQFVHRARMIRSMELLATPDSKIVEIAYSIGYTSLSAFNAAFRKFTRETPSAYRRRFLLK